MPRSHRLTDVVRERPYFFERIPSVYQARSRSRANLGSGTGTSAY